MATKQSVAFAIRIGSAAKRCSASSSDVGSVPIRAMRSIMRARRGHGPDRRECDQAHRGICQSDRTEGFLFGARPTEMGGPSWRCGVSNRRESSDVARSNGASLPSDGASGLNRKEAGRKRSNTPVGSFGKLVVLIMWPARPGSARARSCWHVRMWFARRCIRLSQAQEKKT